MISANCVWEIRTTGSNNNGGGYVGGGTDYSQQDAAQLSLTDLAMKSVPDAVFNGAGLDDMVSSGIATALGISFKIEIDSEGATDTFKWSDDGGATWNATLVAITGGAQALSNGVSVTFTATTGHTAGDYWTLTTNFNLTSATGGLTAAMVGNLIQITAGTNFATNRFYEIKSYTNTNTVVLDRSAESSRGATAGTGAVGGCLSLPEDKILNDAEPGNTFHMKAGTYTLTVDFDSSQGGAADSPISFLGYNTTRGDNPIGDNRPLIAAGAYEVDFNAYYIIKNLRVTTTDYGGLSSRGSILENCKSTNSSVISGRFAIECYISTDGSVIINSEAISTNGNAIDSNYDIKVIGCYIHDSVNGIDVGNKSTITFNIIDTCSNHGIDVPNAFQISNNTIYNCSVGINADYPKYYVILNNIIDTCTTGIQFIEGPSIYKTGYVNYNNYHSNTTDVTNVTKGANATAYDPLFIDAPNGDFSLDSGSSCIGAGFSIKLGV